MSSEKNKQGDERMNKKITKVNIDHFSQSGQVTQSQVLWMRKSQPYGNNKWEEKNVSGSGNNKYKGHKVEKKGYISSTV